MKESGQPVTIDNTAGVISFTPAVANLLTALTPTFANWSQNPGTAADLVGELTDAVLTTNGNGAAGNNTITYNLGSSRQRMVFAHVFDSRAITAGIQISDNGSTWYYLIYNFITNNYDRVGIGKFQYIRYLGINAHTLSEFKLRVYNIN